MQKFLACFLSVQSSLWGPFLCRFAHQFALIPTLLSNRGLQILLLLRTEWFRYNPCSFALHLDGSIKQQQKLYERQSSSLWSKAAVEILPLLSTLLCLTTVFCDRICAHIFCDRISSAQLFRVKTNILCTLKNFKTWNLCLSFVFQKRACQLICTGD